MLSRLRPHALMQPALSSPVSPIIFTVTASFLQGLYPSHEIFIAFVLPYSDQLHPDVYDITADSLTGPAHDGRAKDNSSQVVR